VLEELAAVDAVLELVVAEEVVLAAVDLARPARPRGGRDRDDVAVGMREQPADERTLARP